MLNRHLLAVSVTALVASSPAFAGSPAPAPVDPVIAPVAAAPAAYSWAGGYAGVNLGYAGDKAKHPITYKEYDGQEAYLTERGNLDITSSGFAGGAQVGWNFQSNTMVYGVEADYQASNVKGEVSGNIGPLSGKVGTKLKHFGTIRARVGHTVTDRFLVYGTAGFASGKTETYLRASDSSGSIIDESRSKTKSGWTAGIGAEYAFTDNWSLKSEYLYTDLGKSNVFSDSAGDFGVLDIDRKFNFHMVRVGLNYQF